MKKTLGLLVVLASTSLGDLSAQTGFPTLSPFDGLRWNGDDPDVKLGDRWYELLSIDGIEKAKILAFCCEQYEDRAQKRFREDLVQVLSQMGHPPKNSSVDLELRDLETKNVVVKKRVRMTHDKRQELREQHKEGLGLPQRGEKLRGGPRRGGGSHRIQQVSPFDGLRWNGDVPEVQVGDTWYTLVSYDGVSAEKILQTCKEQHGGRWQKRFGEDLIEVLAGMGHQAGQVADLRLRDIETGKELEKKARATSEKRNAIRNATARRASGAIRAAMGNDELDLAEIDEDLIQLGSLIEQRYSYRDLRGIDTKAVIAEQRGILRRKGRVSTRDLALSVMRILARYGDGHTRLQGSSLFLPPGFTPFALRPLGDRVVALTPDARGLFDADHPYVTAIDGKPIERWLEAVGSIVADGSPQYRHSQALRRLQSIQFARGEIGVNADDSLVVELASRDGRSTTTKKLQVSRSAPSSRRDTSSHKMLDGNVGLLRIPSMDSGSSFESRLHEAMASFAGTDGMIIDVRDNGGGSRDALRTLLPYFLSEDEPARVVNIGAYRLAHRDRANAPDGYLANRQLFPATWSGWSAVARKAIDLAKSQFEPDWQLPRGDFSDWHYMVIERDPKRTYDQPVIVLLDAGCFSATDIFLGGFKGCRNVTLMGQPSGGGSGRSQTHRLPNSGIEFRLSTMASFTPSGQRYDGVGIAPDVVVTPEVTDLTGATDRVLEAARKRLAK